MPYEEVFYRPSDAVVADASRVELSDRCFANVRVRLELMRTPPVLRIGGEVFEAADQPWMSLEATEVVLPREAMGFGDVKFMAAIGAFLGWKATVFSLFASAVIGSLVAIVLIALGRQKWTGRLGYGPYIAMAAVVWVFAGRHIVELWLGLPLGG
jgi:leader peptidase (prepilin peptidase)/N-methyltransferase